MSTLDTRSFDTIVGTIAAGMQGRINAFLNFVIGTWLRGLAEAYAGVGLWFQKLALDIAKLTRLSTSYGSDVDSFIADFPLAGVARLGAQAATGAVTFSRYTPSASAPVISVGTIVQTGDGSQKFAVYADTTNAAYSESSGGYVMPAQTTDLVGVPVVNVTNGPAGAPGANGNIAAGAISAIGFGAPSGISNVTNPAAFTNGIDVESDASVKSRFLLAVQGRGGGTIPAIQSAVANLKVGMSCVVLENQDIDGTPDQGMVSVIVDDGSGNISTALLAAAVTAVNNVHAAGIRIGVYAATTTLANNVMQLGVKVGYDRPTVVAQVAAALGLSINGTGQNATLPYFSPAAVALGVSGVSEIVLYTLNGGTADLAGTPQTTIKTGTLVVS